MAKWIDQRVFRSQTLCLVLFRLVRGAVSCREPIELRVERILKCTLTTPECHRIDYCEGKTLPSE